MLDRLGDFFFGEVGDKITKVGITVCGIGAVIIMLSKILEAVI